jgi:hypothetical protein
MSANAQNFSPGNLVVVRVGDGVAALATNGNGVFIEEHSSSSGALVGPILPIPSSGPIALIMSGVATSEGALSLSGDGQSLAIAGYNSAPLPVGNISASTVPRVVSMVTYSRLYQFGVSSATYYSGNTLRGGATDGLNNFWGAASAGGTFYFGNTAPAAVVQTAQPNTRVVQDLFGNLMFSMGAGTRGIYVMPGTPKVATAASLLFGTGTASSPYDFAINSAGTIAYVADDSAVTAGGGVQRWVFAGGSWSLQYTLGTGAGSTVGARGLAVNFSGATPVIFATTAETSQNRIIKITDSGASSTATTLSTAAPNTVYRGLKFSPQPRLSVTCPSDMTVSASSSSGATVNFTATGTTTCPPLTIMANPPSGSFFPIGTTVVTVTASDACLDTNICTFKVTVNPPPIVTEYFTPNFLLPPSNTVYISPALYHVLYANGIIIRDIRHRFFTQNLPPPPLGGTQIHVFGSEVDFQISMDNGATFQPGSGMANVQVKVFHGSDSGGVSYYDTEMLQLNLAGPGFMLRESPTLQSLGRTSTRPVTGGFMVSSFFDVFTELSLDGGATWTPSSGSAHVELRNDPAASEYVGHPTSLLPPPNGAYVSPALWHALFAQGVVIKDVSHKFFTTSIVPPAPGGSNYESFNSTVDLSVSTDGGNTYQSVRASAPVQISISGVGSGANGFYDTEMTGLTLSGLPNGIMVRESPSLPSRGGTEALMQSDGSFRISSFFDIFTELSTDGGATWSPASNGPVRMQLTQIAPEQTTSTPDLPAPGGSYITPAKWHALYANGIIITNVTHRRFTQSYPPPPPGAGQTENFGSMVDGLISLNGGATFTPFSAPANVSISVQSRSDLDQGATRFFDTEMLSMNLAGGTLPAGVMVRESPTKASLGKTSVRTASDDYRISSFFDIFTEVSLDNGKTWSTMVSSSATVSMIPHGPPPVCSGPACPANMTLYALNSSGRVVNYTVFILYGDCPFGSSTLTCVPPSGSFFPIGNTLVTCTVTDSCCHTTASCSFTITILPQLQKIPEVFNTQALLPPPNFVYITPALSNLPYSASILIRDIRSRFFTLAEEPPALGMTRNQTFETMMQFDLSTDGGQTYNPFSANGTATVRLTHSSDSGGISQYDTEMQQLDVSGGSLPPGIMLRESPTLQSKGQTTIRPVSGGYMISSFFDVFTDISVDGGQTWTPASSSGHVEGRPDPMQVGGVPEPTRLLPPPNDQFVSPPKWMIQFAPGLVIKDVRSKLPSLSMQPPGPNTTTTQAYTSVLDMQISMDGGKTFQFARTMAPMQITTASTGSGTGTFFDNQTVSVSFTVPLASASIMLRESPSLPSRGTTQIVPMADGTFRINSFFDVFTELSLDNGNTWWPGSNGPVRMTLVSLAVEVPEPSPNLPPLDGQYVSPAQWHAAYDNGIIISNASHNQFTQSVPPPPPGGLQQENFNSLVSGLISLSPGTPFQPFSAPAAVSIMVSSRQDLDTGATRFFDTEMLSLSVSNGTLPGGVMVRESPTKASLGRTSVRGAGPTGFEISSFFDVFTEISLDSGKTWHGATNAPGTVAQRPQTNSLVEVDNFLNTEAELTLQYPDGQTEVITLTGPTTVNVNIPPNGAAGDSNGNGLDDVTSEIVAMNLTGAGSIGPVMVTLDPSQRSLGMIEETANNTPGILDIPPFTPTGSANSFFDVFVVINVSGLTLHPAAPLHLQSLITHKPPAPGETYVNPYTQPIVLLDATGKPTGFKVLREVHTPNPTNRPPVEIDYFPNTTAQITLQSPSGQSEVVSLSGPTTVKVNIPPNGAAADSNGNGLDDVATEITQLDLDGTSSMGPVMVTLNPGHRSFGMIEEVANNTPGILDIPPFTATGMANSFFDVFVEITVNGQTLHPSNAVHMTSLIHHKPPAPGDSYVNPFTQPIPLLDANGNPTGFYLLSEVHTPTPTNQPPVEIDYFSNTTAQVTLKLPGGGTEVVNLSGPTTVKVNIPPNGAASDTDGNGLDQVTTEMTQLDLSGISSLGPVNVNLDPANRSFGEIEEIVNNTPGILDIPPFTPTGSANSFFDVFVEITVNGQTMRPAAPLHMASVIHNKPPAPGDSYVNPFTAPIPLLDANGNPTGFYVLQEVHTPNPTNPPPVEIDHFPNTTAQITIQTPSGPEVVTLTGPSTVRVSIGPGGQASDSNGNGLDDVPTEMVLLSLTGASSMGPVSVDLDPAHRSFGSIEETVNNTPGILDIPPFTPTGTANSFFDIFALISINGQTLHPANALHMTSLIHHKPPAPGDSYTNPFTTPVPLLDANGNPTGFYVLQEVHTPNPTNTPPVEIDNFPNTTAQITLTYASGLTETVNLQGPTTVEVNIPPSGAAGDSDGNGLDDVSTEMTLMNLTGNSSMGPMTVTLDPSQRSLGMIEEIVNNTPGILDIPPFTPSGSARSFFDVFVEIQVAGQTFHPAIPLHMQAVITYKPPGPGEPYVNTFTNPVPVLDANGNPTGISIVREVHIPNPKTPVEVDHFPNTSAQITLQTPAGQQIVNLSGPTTVIVNIPPSGAASDLNGDGLDEVTTEMTEMNLSGNSALGPVTVMLDPMRPTLGKIEENVNNTPGVLDVPPFTATGTASSFFDVFVLVKVGGQTLHSAGPLHMTSTITHKPPGRGDTYTNPFTQPVPLLDANGNPTGFQILQEVHTPNPTNPPPVEIDHFPNTVAYLTLQLINGLSEQVALSGPTTVQVNIPPNGAASDLDGNGLDQVTTEMLQLSLSGNSSMGPVSVNLDPMHASYGGIEETVNSTPGILDIPPFTATGTANSFFDVFAEIHVGPQTLHPAAPLHLTSLITHKPPRRGDTYVNPFTQPIDLLDANGNPTGIKVLKEVHTPNPTNPPPVEIDHFPFTTAQVLLQVPGGGTVSVALTGPTTVHVNIPPNGAALDLDGDGLDQVKTEMTDMNLVGLSPFGPVRVTLDPMHPTYGGIEETANNTPGILDLPPFTATGTANSFFDVFAVVQVGGQTYYPATPIHLAALIHHKPPAPGDSYVNPFNQPIPLLDANGNPTGFYILQEVHTPNPTNPPPVEVDYFSNTTAQITLKLPSGQTEQVNLAGPTRVIVNIPPNGAASDTDGNGLDQVATEMTDMSLTGNSSLGAVLLNLDPLHPSYGGIEETVNSTPGILDVPPFTGTGSANSFFDVFTEVHVGGNTYYPSAPLHMTALIHHKPPSPGDNYVNPFTQPIDLLDANGYPTGIKILQEVHTPNPSNPPPVEVDYFSNTVAEVTLQYPNNQTELVVLRGPTTVNVYIAPNGACGDSDNNGLNDVATHMTQLDLTGNSSMGPVTVSLDPSQPTLGKIEETVNNTPGILDVPPFTATGTANSFFDVFFEVQIGALMLHPAQPLHLSSVITHKPPAPGDTYVSPAQQIALLDANGNPTGFYLTHGRHIPNPSNAPITLNCSSNITVSATSSNGAVVFYSSSASGGCSPPPVLICNPPSGSTFPIGITLVTCTASDSCGNKTNCSFQVTVVRPPITLTCSSNITVTTASCTNTSATVFFSSSASGGCAPLTLSCNPPSGGSFPLGTTLVTCTASDACGGSTNCSFNVTVNPFVCPAITLTCSSNITVTTASCTNTGATVFFSSSAFGGCAPLNLSCNPPSGSSFSLGTTPVNCVATDACGHSTNCSFNVTVKPFVCPPITLTCSSNITVTTANAAGTTVFFTSTASGGCPPLNLVCNPPSGSSFPLGTTPVNCVASDSCGNTTNCGFTVTVLRLVITITPVGNQLQLNWPQGTLQESDDVLGPYIDVDPQPTPPYLITPSEKKHFYRVRVGQPGFTFYDTEMLQLDISGGGLPAGMRIRESPTLASTGKTAISPASSGGFTISSFFDVFTELSMDNGQTWLASTSPPPRMRFVGTAPTNTLPPTAAQYVSPAQWHALYAQGIIITNASHLDFLGSFPPPGPGGVTNIHSFSSSVQMQVRLCPTCPLQPITAPAQVTVQVKSRP